MCFHFFGHSLWEFPFSRNRQNFPKGLHQSLQCDRHSCAFSRAFPLTPWALRPLAPPLSRPLESPGQGLAPRLTCEGQGAGEVDQGDVIAVLLTVGVSKGEIAPMVDYCLHPQLQAVG